MHTEKENHEISKVCEQARNLLKSIDNTDLSVVQTLNLVKEMHSLDKISRTWRDGPEWTYRTIHPSELRQARGDAASKLPKFIELHRDVWMAYEWNYHRTARIILHEHLLLCLDRLQSLCSGYPGDQDGFNTELCSLKQASTTIIRALMDEILSTVPQSLGDIDNEGNIVDVALKSPKCQGVGGYFLLWPIKIAKGTCSATAEQIVAAQSVFERIRECTGMKSALGDASII